MRHSSDIQPYSGELVKSLINYMKFGIIIHLVFAIFFYGDEHIFPTKMHFDPTTLDPTEPHLAIWL